MRYIILLLSFFYLPSAFAQNKVKCEFESKLFDPGSATCQVNRLAICGEDGRWLRSEEDCSGVARIKVDSAFYACPGDNPIQPIRDSVAAICDGKSSCQFTVDARNYGAAHFCPHVPKTANVNYFCMSGGKKVRSASAAAKDFATLGISCE
jgi:hypothetical protein